MNKKEFMIVLVVTFVVIMLWIISDLVHTRASVIVSPKLEATLEEVDPTFDQDTLSKISRLPNSPSFTTPVLNPSLNSPPPNLSSPSTTASESAGTGP